MDRLVIKIGGLGQQGIRIGELAPHEVHVLQAIGEQADAIALRDLVQLSKLLVEAARLERRSLEILLTPTNNVEVTHHVLIRAIGIKTLGQNDCCPQESVGNHLCSR